MKLVIIRHGDPDYVNDALTEQGKVEAKLLAERMAKVDAKEYFVSPLGRAKMTASYTLEKLGRTATECEWLKEFFTVQIKRPDCGGADSIAWDWLPQDWNNEPQLYDKDKWLDMPVYAETTMREEYNRVVGELDKLLEKHGYKRNGNFYDVIEPNNDTLVFFCHFGLECVLLSHLINVSPMILWHGTCAAPTSVTTVATEERRRGTASFRISAFGDTSHLYVAGVEPSFSARFCECYDNEDERHD